MDKPNMDVHFRKLKKIKESDAVSLREMHKILDNNNLRVVKVV